MSTKSVLCRSAAFMIGSWIALATPSAASATTADIVHADGPRATDVTTNAFVTLKMVPTLNGGGLAVNPVYGRQARAFLRAAGGVLAPANWITMILGFGAIGWASCRRRAVGRAVA